MSIQSDTDRGLEIVTERERLAQELRLIEGRLIKAGLAGEQSPLQDEDREGRQWIAKGTREDVPVIFTADLLVGTFADGSAVHIQLHDSIGAAMKQFFKPMWKNIHSDGKAFRARAVELFGDKAAALITTCLARDKDGIPKSKMVVAWNEAKRRPQ